MSNDYRSKRETARVRLQTPAGVELLSSLLSELYEQAVKHNPVAPTPEARAAHVAKMAETEARLGSEKVWQNLMKGLQPEVRSPESIAEVGAAWDAWDAERDPHAKTLLQLKLAEYVARLLEHGEALGIERQRWKARAEQAETQLAGCATAAMGAVADDVVAKQGDYGWSASYQDVVDLRRKYDAFVSARHLALEAWEWLSGTHAMLVNASKVAVGERVHKAETCLAGAVDWEGKHPAGAVSWASEHLEGTDTMPARYWSVVAKGIRIAREYLASYAIGDPLPASQVSPWRNGILQSLDEIAERAAEGTTIPRFDDPELEVSKLPFS